MATYSALPSTLNLVATVGNDFSLALTVTENGSPWVATGATLTTDIIDSSGTVVATDFTTAASTGTVSLSLTDANTTTLGVGVYSYRLSVTKSSLTRDWIAGTLSIVEAGVGGRSTSDVSLAITDTTISLTLNSMVASNAANIIVADAGNNYTGDDVEEVLAELPGKFMSLTADNVATGVQTFRTRVRVRTNDSTTSDPGVNMKPAGSGLTAMWEGYHEDNEGYVFHINCAAGMGDPGGGSVAAIYGTGCDYGGTGYYAHIRTEGGGGRGFYVGMDDGVTATDAYGFSGSVSSGNSPLSMFIQSPGATAAQPAMIWWAQTAVDSTQKLCVWRKPNTLSAGTDVGYVRATDGMLVWNAPAVITSDATGNVPFTVQGFTGHTANLQEWYVPVVGTVASINKDGAMSLSSTITAAGGLISGATPTLSIYQTSGNTTNERRFQWGLSSGLLVLSARNDAGSSTGDLLYIKHTNGNITPKDGAALVLGTTTGFKIGSATTQKLGFYNATPVVQPSGIGAAATDAATTQTLANNLRTALINLGLVAA